MWNVFTEDMVAKKADHSVLRLLQISQQHIESQLERVKHERELLCLYLAFIYVQIIYSYYLILIIDYCILYIQICDILHYILHIIYKI